MVSDTKIHRDAITDLSDRRMPKTLLLSERVKPGIRQVTGRVRTLDAWKDLSREFEAQYEALISLVCMGNLVRKSDLKVTVDAILEQASVHLDREAVKRLRAFAKRRKSELGYRSFLQETKPSNARRGMEKRP